MAVMFEESKRLRVEPKDGLDAQEYRLGDGTVEMRTLALKDAIDEDEYVESRWWQLTPEQLSIHVEHNTAVAQWLERRVGWRSLLRACVGEGFLTHSTEHESRNSLGD